MNDDNHLEDHLVQLGQAFEDEARFVSKVMDRIDRGEHLARLRHLHRRRLIVKSTIAASLSAAASARGTMIEVATMLTSPPSRFTSPNPSGTV